MAARSALVIRGGAIGDFILTMPAIQLLKASIADCRVDILGYPGITSLAIAAGLAETTRDLEHRHMAMLFVPNAKLDAELDAWLCSFNVVVSYLFDPDGIVRANMERIGVRTFLDAPQRVIEGAGHAAKQLAQPLESLAMYLDDLAPRIIVPNAAPLTNRIAIHPGSGSLKKNWPLQHWLRVIEELHDENLIVITGEAERERGIAAAIAEAAPQIEHWQGLDLPELARRLSGCAAFVGHDSGISHLAAACGLPCHLFFGPTDPGTWAPQNIGVRVHRASQQDVNAMTWDEGWRAIRSFVEQNVSARL